MSKKITITIFIVACLVYVFARYTNADARLTDFIGGMLIGIMIGMSGGWISKLKLVISSLRRR